MPLAKSRWPALGVHRRRHHSVSSSPARIWSHYENSLVWPHHTLFILMMMGCFSYLAIMNKPSMNTLVQVLLWAYVFVFPGYLLRGGSGWLNLHSTAGYSYFSSWPSLAIVNNFNFSHSDVCVVVSHCDFNLHLSDK